MESTEEQLIHDLRNVATIVRGAAETLHTDGASLSEEMISNLGAMLARRSEMLVRLIDDLATVHALNSGSLDLQIHAVDLAETVRSVVADHHELADSGVVSEIPADAFVLADPLRLVQIIDNLLTNAVRYGGSAVEIRAERDGDEVAFSVRDDGGGIDPATAESMFAPYARGAESRLFGGSGLGLAIVRELCAALGGTVSYDGEEGTTFTVRLPAVPTTAVDLGQDAARKGHAVSFWKDHQMLAEIVARYAAAGLVRGEAVVLALTGSHQLLVQQRLAELGIDISSAQRRGQYLVIDAAAVRSSLEVDGRVDPDRFDEVIGGAIRTVGAQWRTFRVFGEIVDLFWRDGDGHLAIELESCWNRLRSQVDFPLYCGYEMTAGQQDVCACHDTVLIA